MLGSSQGSEQIPCPVLCSLFEASIGANDWNTLVEGKKAHLQIAGQTSASTMLDGDPYNLIWDTDQV